ncbi:hypothetical protein [Nocardioides speluncae]|uniref:hypothetical protein n=1 Tax=Nocardioides speluncae TaxID=2670337 RepID=UPI000D69B077|nr:hypothetical protein [Nocardioides speluncae]
MTVRIELWLDGALVGGADHWWDDIEGVLNAIDGGFPQLRKVDPYGVAIFASSALDELGREARELSRSAPNRAAGELSRIAELCDDSHRATSAELRFLGD